MLTEWEGKPVKPITYDYQIIEYTRGPRGTVVPSGVQGSGGRQRGVALAGVVPESGQLLTRGRQEEEARGKAQAAGAESGGRGERGKPRSERRQAPEARGGQPSGYLRRAHEATEVPS